MFGVGSRYHSRPIKTKQKPGRLVGKLRRLAGWGVIRSGAKKPSGGSLRKSSSSLVGKGAHRQAQGLEPFRQLKALSSSMGKRSASKWPMVETKGATSLFFSLPMRRDQHLSAHLVSLHLPPTPPRPARFSPASTSTSPSSSLLENEWIDYRSGGGEKRGTEMARRTRTTKTSALAERAEGPPVDSPAQSEERAPRWVNALTRASSNGARANPHPFPENISNDAYLRAIRVTLPVGKTR